jgi:hypothetical protein
MTPYRGSDPGMWLELSELNSTDIPRLDCVKLALQPVAGTLPILSEARQEKLHID